MLEYPYKERKFEDFLIFTETKKNLFNKVFNVRVRKNTMFAQFSEN
jgi:hypothetical protein